MANGLSFIFSPVIREKIEKTHKVFISEVEECFYNREGEFYEDNRDQHKTDPPTQWFVAETDRGRKLKIIFVKSEDGIRIKSAYDANQAICKLYKKMQQGRGR